MVELSYEKDFDERNILTKACPIQMNKEFIEVFKKELNHYWRKNLLNPQNLLGVVQF